MKNLLDDQLNIFENQEGIELSDHSKLQNRKLISQNIDILVSQSYAMIKDGSVTLTPSYQRRRRWSVEAKSLLIESLIMNVPLPSIFFAEEKESTYSVIDGQQRLSTICEFFDNEFELKGLEVFNHLNGLRFEQLTPEVQSVIRKRSLRVIIIFNQSDPDIKLDVFERLNTGGVKLSTQEIRNAAFPGRFNEFLISSSANPKFQRMLDIDPEKPLESQIYSAMKDCELVLRFISMSCSEYNGKLDDFLTTFMAANQNATPSTISQWSDLFESTVDKVETVFGDSPFKKYISSKDQWHGRLNAAVYDAQMIVLGEVPTELVNEHAEKIRDAFMRLCDNPQFNDAVSAATSHKSAFLTRISKMREAVRAATR